MWNHSPKAKQMRRFGIALSSSPKYLRILERRPNPPGQHGVRARRPKIGAYGRRLVEKQKLKAFYGVAERQMRRYIADAGRRQGPTGENLLVLLECRLDAIVYRLGFTPSIHAARQLVGHGHILVDGARVDIASCRVTPGQTIALSERMKMSAQIGVWRDIGALPPPAYLEGDRLEMRGRLLRLPQRDEIPVPVEERLIVEFYSR